MVDGISGSPDPFQGEILTRDSLPPEVPSVGDGQGEEAGPLDQFLKGSISDTYGPVAMQKIRERGIDIDSPGLLGALQRSLTIFFEWPSGLWQRLFDAYAQHSFPRHHGVKSSQPDHRQSHSAPSAPPSLEEQALFLAGLALGQVKPQWRGPLYMAWQDVNDEFRQSLDSPQLGEIAGTIAFLRHCLDPERVVHDLQEMSRILAGFQKMADGEARRRLLRPSDDVSFAVDQVITAQPKFSELRGAIDAQVANRLQIWRSLQQGRLIEGEVRRVISLPASERSSHLSALTEQIRTVLGERPDFRVLNDGRVLLWTEGVSPVIVPRWIAGLAYRHIQQSPIVLAHDISDVLQESGETQRALFPGLERRVLQFLGHPPGATFLEKPTYGRGLLLQVRRMILDVLGREKGTALVKTIFQSLRDATTPQNGGQNGSTSPPQAVAGPSFAPHPSSLIAGPRIPVFNQNPGNGREQAALHTEPSSSALVLSGTDGNLALAQPELGIAETRPAELGLPFLDYDSVRPLEPSPEERALLDGASLLLASGSPQQEPSLFGLENFTLKNLTVVAILRPAPLTAANPTLTLVR